ncbi:MAG: MarR family transcriptional regulator [Saprospiraceae bacterium]|nr:MAG: MarR family transcriptional regulator [Saprospiraceae bacterium]
MRIEDEIKQSAFSNVYHKAHINILYTAAWLNLKVVQWLKPFGLTHQQFNVLRILRGSRPKPLNIKEITERMIDRSSNASRLVDKLIAKNMVRKTTSPEDGRQVLIHITDVGLSTVAKASIVVERNLLETFSSLSEAEAAQISDLLDKLRG